ncbi:MAG TPA: hypothetical protein VGC22_09955 [Chitinophaga sp.]
MQQRKGKLCLVFYQNTKRLPLLFFLPVQYQMKHDGKKHYGRMPACIFLFHGHTMPCCIPAGLWKTAE